MSLQPTPRQQQIIDEQSNLLVVAGPGSGKTATLVLKISHILANEHNLVCAVTFTRDGASELRTRLSRVLTPRQLARLTVATFHSLSIEHLSRHKQLRRVATPKQQRAFLARCRDLFAPQLDAGDMQLAFEAVKCAVVLSPALQEVADSPWFRAYEQTLQRHDMVDLHDVMRLAVQKMSSGEIPPIECTHLVVDETQDNDELQAAWVACHRHQAVTMVGDDDQCIFEWRRAIGFHGMLRFKEQRSARVILLEDNFRSHTEIVQAASAVIARNDPWRNKKSLVPRRGTGGCVVKVAAGSTAATCAAVQSLLADSLVDLGKPAAGMCKGVASGTWAVLARTNLLLDYVESHLTSCEVRTYRPTGSLWSHPIAQAALQMLNALLCLDTVGIDIAMHHARLPQADIAAVLDANRADVAALLDGQGELAGAKDKRVPEFFQRTARWRRLLACGSFSSAIERVCDFVAAHVPASKRASAEVILQPLAKRLNRMAGDPAQRVGMLLNDRSTRSVENAVLLYTMHGSKGLEFDNVVIVGVDEKEIPGDAVDLPPGSPGIRPGQSTVQAERRLLYVAMTRAKRRLWLVHSFADPSRFIGELPAGTPTLAVRASD